MRERGWIEGENVIFERLYSDGRSERFPGLAADLVQRRVDLIITAGTPPTAAAKGATSTIPIVFFYVGDPVVSGLVASLARPGGNVTGTGGLGTGLHGKMLDLLKEVVPKATRIAMFVNSTLALHAAYRAELEPAARSMGITLTPVEVRASEDLDAAFAAITRDKADALLILGQPLMAVQRAQIARMALQHRMPAINVFVEVAEAGLLMSYGNTMIDDMRRLPYYVDRILKGSNPAELPVELASKYHFAINLKTAKALGITIPPAVLQRADQVIE
jgi:putative ABC transport system substrate-binding protein